MSQVPKLQIKNTVADLPRYGDAKTLFQTFHAQNLPQESKPSHVVNPIMKEFKKYMGIKFDAKYDGVNPNRKNVWISLNKMFERPKLTYDTKLLNGRIYRIMKRVFSPLFKSGLQWDPTITEDAVPGAPWKYFGFKTKEEVLNSPLFAEEHLKCRHGKQPYPPYVSAGKREFLSKEELAENKIRTFLMAPLELLLDEKWLYGTQDENMKKHQPGFVRYGINLHNGGMDQMIKESSHAFWIEYDVKGWDRKLAILRTVMKLRNECLREAVGEEIWKEISPVAERVTDALVNHKLILPDGSVVQWDWSQMSGDGLTTSNNCLAHMFIALYLLIKANPQATDEEILDQGMNLYGDDNLAGLSEKFQQLRSEKFVNRIYEEFGLMVKPGTWKCQDVPMGMSFLGATVRAFKKRGTVYFVPSYKRDRVLTGLYMSTEYLSPDEELMKARSLLEIGWYDCYDEIRNYIDYLLLKIPESPVKRSFMKTGIPDRHYIRDTWAGLYVGR